MGYKQGETGYFRENSLNAEFYRTYLRDTFGIRRYEWESCGYRQEFPEGKNSIHVPFYQTNTSQYCTLYAACKNGERGTAGIVSGILQGESLSVSKAFEDGGAV